MKKLQRIYYLSYLYFFIIYIFQNCNHFQTIIPTKAFFIFKFSYYSPFFFCTVLRWLFTCLDSHCTLNFWLIYVATLTKDYALKMEEDSFPLSASLTNILSSIWDIGLDHVKCLPLHFSFFMVLISTKNNKFIQNKII